MTTIFSQWRYTGKEIQRKYIKMASFNLLSIFKKSSAVSSITRYCWTTCCIIKIKPFYLLIYWFESCSELFDKKAEDVCVSMTLAENPKAGES